MFMNLHLCSRFELVTINRQQRIAIYARNFVSIIGAKADLHM